MSNRSTMQQLLSVLMAWLLVQTVLRFGGLFLTALLVLLTGLVCLTIYGLRFDRPRMARLFQTPAGRVWIAFVCRFSQQQIPVDVAVEGHSPVIQLKTSEDFEWCCGKLQEEVFGHDFAIRKLTERLQRTVQLRSRSGESQGMPPLGTFVLAGPQGIGKRYLASRMAQRLFRKYSITVLDLRDFTDTTAIRDLLGAPGQDGILSSPIRRNPYHVIILENFERACSKTMEILQSILQNGECTDGATNGRVSFSHCLLFLISHHSVSDSSASPEQWIDMFATQTGCTPALLNMAGECVSLQSPDDEAIARTLICLMMEECHKYHISLDWVDPEIVAREVTHFSERFGFEQSRSRITRWISEPLHLASSHGLSGLALTESLLSRKSNAGSQPNIHLPVSQLSVQQAN